MFADMRDQVKYDLEMQIKKLDEKIALLEPIAEAAGALVGDIMAAATDDNDLPLHFLSWTRLREALETHRKK